MRWRGRLAGICFAGTCVIQSSSNSDSLIVGNSPAIRHAAALAQRLARSELPVLLVGATGTGKELFAEQIHRWSGRGGVFVDVNCAALPHEMTEALLFGHRRGAFTGAVEHSRGLFEEADGGSLFLDEVLSMPVSAQAKLLRVLETGEVRRLGETVKRRISVRIVSAAQEDIRDRVARGDFRRDLLQRLAGAVIELPTLAARGEDIWLLANHFASLRQRQLHENVAAVLQSYAWPGNVRELRLAIDRAALLSDAAVMTARVLAESVAIGAAIVAGEPRGISSVGEAASSAREHVLAICAANDWNAVRTARALGLGRTTFFKELKALGISLRQSRSDIDRRLQRIGTM